MPDVNRRKPRVLWLFIGMGGSECKKSEANTANSKLDELKIKEKDSGQAKDFSKTCDSGCKESNTKTEDPNLDSLNNETVKPRYVDERVDRIKPSDATSEVEIVSPIRPQLDNGGSGSGQPELCKSSNKPSQAQSRTKRLKLSRRIPKRGATLPS